MKQQVNIWRSVKAYFVKRKNRKTPITVDEFLKGLRSTRASRSTLLHHRRVLINAGFLLETIEGGVVVAGPLSQAAPSYKEARSLAA